MGAMRTAAILPVKRFASAKSRLGASVEDTLRERLARAMVSDVLRALGESAAIERTIVVTREESLRAAAEQHGALMIEDTAESANRRPSRSASSARSPAAPSAFSACPATAPRSIRPSSTR